MPANDSTPAAPRARSGEERLVVYQHSDLLYWWAVWAYGYFCALLTWWHGKSVVLVEGGRPVLIYPRAWLGISFVALTLFVLLFTNDPTPSPAVHPDVVAAAGGVDGAAIFDQRCSGCHGGDGSGGIGPRLAGGRVVADFADPQQQIAFVTNGQGGMPAFGERLTADEIAAVVDYTRTVLADVHP